VVPAKECALVSQTIWIVDTQNRSAALAESISSVQVEVISVQATSSLAQSIASRSNGAVIANIHENEDFETLEHLSKISLTFPEIPLVLLLPEPLHASIDWGPRVFNLIKPVSPESILKRLSFLDEHSYPTRGILQRGYLLALLDHCLLQKKHVRILIRYAGAHSCELLIRNGKLVSLYIDNSLKNDKILFPFALDGAEFSMEHLEESSDTTEIEPRFHIGEDEYRRFRLELHPFLSLMQQFPPMSEVLRIDNGRLMKVLNSLPEQVHSVIRHFDGSNDLFQIFLQSELRPLETAQRIGYLYFSDVFHTPSQSAGGAMFPDASSAPGQGSPAAAMRERSSSELAGWLLNPVAAARELEAKIKKNLKTRKPADAQFRPHRKTQPGLGGLLRPVIEEDSEDEASRSSWGGVNVRLLRESQEMLLKMTDSEEAAIPGLSEQVIEFEEDGDSENADASGVIDVSVPEDPAVGEPGSPKIILDTAPVFSGEAELPAAEDAPAVGKTVAEGQPSETFHDEPTMPLDQLEEAPESVSGEPPPAEQVAQDSLLELLSLRSEERSHTVPMRTLEQSGPSGHQTREMPAVSVPDEDQTPDPGLRETPVPNFDEEPNSSRTPRPLIAVDDPTPLPENDDPLLDTTAAEITGGADPDPLSDGSVETTLRVERLPAGRTSRDDVQTFQKQPSAGRSKWAYMAVVALVAALGIWYVFRTPDHDMKVSDRPAQDDPTPGPGPGMEPAGEMVASDTRVMEPVMEPVTEPPMEPATEPPMEPVTEPPMEPASDPATTPGTPGTPELAARAGKLYEDYNRQGRRQLLTELEKLAAENPGLAPAAAYLGDIYYRRDRIQKAREWAQKAVELDSEMALGWWVIGLVAYEARQKAVYVNAFRNYLRISPNDQNAKTIRQMGIRELKEP
jgi:hypothetical protein